MCGHSLLNSSRKCMLSISLRVRICEHCLDWAGCRIVIRMAIEAVQATQFWPQS